MHGNHYNSDENKVGAKFCLEILIYRVCGHIQLATCNGHLRIYWLYYVLIPFIGIAIVYIISVFHYETILYLILQFNYFLFIFLSSGVNFVFSNNWLDVFDFQIHWNVSPVKSLFRIRYRKHSTHRWMIYFDLEKTRRFFLCTDWDRDTHQH